MTVIALRCGTRGVVRCDVRCGAVRCDRAQCSAVRSDACVNVHRGALLCLK